MINEPQMIYKFNSEAEIIYRRKFSNWRYKTFFIIEKLYKMFINNKDSRLEIIANKMQNARPVSILEIGSGTLPIYAFLPKLLKEICQYHVCEVNLKKAEFIAEKYKNISVSCSDALNLPYRDNFFDFVFSKGVLHHVDDKDSEKRRNKRLRFLLESKRVLRDGGSNLIMDFTYNYQRLKDFFWHFLHKILLFEGEHNFSTKKETENLFREANYKEISSEEFETFKGLYYYVIAKK